MKGILNTNRNFNCYILEQAKLHAFQLEQSTASHTEYEDTSSPDETVKGKLAEYTRSPCMS
jgi:hypothetical protein